MTGEKAVRTSARFIWLAAELRAWRTTSVVIGSASARAAAREAPARWVSIGRVSITHISVRETTSSPWAPDAADHPASR